MRRYIGEIFSSIQGEGIYAGRRQIFVRFAGCRLRCNYCDTLEFRDPMPPTCLIEIRGGSGKFKKVRNPLTVAEITREIRRLKTPDLHSVSLTGGEPLLAGRFLVEVARAVKRMGLRTYLETSGADSRAMKIVAPLLDYAAVDLKLPEHHAVPEDEWPALLKEELESVGSAVEQNVKTFVKIVVLRSTELPTIRRVCKKLKSVVGVPVVLQPVTPVRRGVSPPPPNYVFRMAEEVAKLGFEVWVIPQLHPPLGVK